MLKPNVILRWQFQIGLSGSLMQFERYPLIYFKKFTLVGDQIDSQHFQRHVTINIDQRYLLFHIGVEISSHSHLQQKYVMANTFLCSRWFALVGIFDVINVARSGKSYNYCFVNFCMLCDVESLYRILTVSLRSVFYAEA